MTNRIQRWNTPYLKGCIRKVDSSGQLNWSFYYGKNNNVNTTHLFRLQQTKTLLQSNAYQQTKLGISFLIDKHYNTYPYK